MRDSFKHPGERMRHYRERARISQKEFAARIGIKPPSLSEIESGESKAPSAPTLLRAAAELGVDPWHLLTGEGPPVRAVQNLREDEIRLLMMYRELPPTLRLDLETEANRLHARAHPVRSALNPYPKATRRTAREK